MALGIQLVAPATARALSCGDTPETWRLPDETQHSVLPGNVGFWVYTEPRLYSGTPWLWDADDNPVELELAHQVSRDDCDDYDNCLLRQICG